MKMTVLQRLESRIVHRVLRASDTGVKRRTQPRWEVDGCALDRRTQYMFQVGRRAERSIPSMTPRAARRYYARLNRVLEADAPDVERTQELRIPTRAGERAARVYVPPGASVELPGLVYFHGGGFCIGSLETHDTLCRRVCVGARCVVVSFDYRLAPEHPFPAAVEDADDGYRWVVAHARELGIRTGSIAVGGDSAGGNLAAVVSFLSRERGRDMPSAQLLVYPTTGVDHEGRRKAALQKGYGLEAKTIRWFADHYLPMDCRNDPRASPLTFASHSDLPPAVVVTAQFDLLCAEGSEYADKLRAAGVSVTHLHMPDLPHGFGTMSVLPRAKEAIDQFNAALHEKLRA